MVNAPEPKSTPVLFFSHGSTMMLGEESTSADFWYKCGRDAENHGFKNIVLMGAHWECLNDEIQVAYKVNPDLSPVAYVAAEKYINYKINVDLELSDRCISMLDKAKFKVSANKQMDWIHGE